MRKRCFAIFILAMLIICTDVMPFFSVEGAEIFGNPDEEVSIVQKIKNEINGHDYNNLLQGAMPCRGDAHVLVINLVQEGVENYVSTDTIEDMLFGEHCSYESNVVNENLTDYFDSISYGKVHVTGEVIEYPCNTFVEGDITMLAGILDDVLSLREAEQFDQNEDGYLDGVYFFVPTLAKAGRTPAWEYEREGYSSSAYVLISKKLLATYDSIGTVCHETVHLMGLPDIYGNVGVNMSGTYADTVMEGKQQAWNSERGSITSNLPGIMKLFFGWIDEVVEVSASGSYSLRSYSKYPEAMVLYPNGDRESRFIFFAELMTEDNNDRIIDAVSDERGGGIRIWRVLLNVDEDGNIVGNDRVSGVGNSPFRYIEALHNDSTSYYLYDGEQINTLTDPNMDYFLDCEIGEYYDEVKKKTFTNACLPSGFLSSAISIDNVDIEGKTAIIDISYEEIWVHIIRFDSNGGSGSMPNQEAFEEFILPDCSFGAPGGMEFKAWDIDGIMYQPGDTVAVTSDITVKAVWERLPREAFDISYLWKKIEVDNASGYVVTGIATLKSMPGYIEKEYADIHSEYTNPGCEEYGEELWIAEFKNDLFETQYKSELIEPIGHDWDPTEYIWADDFSNVTAKRICSWDRSHVETETVETTAVVVQPSSWDGKGKTEYTAAFQNPGFEEQKLTTEGLPENNPLDTENVLTLPGNLSRIENEAFTGILSQIVIIPVGCTEIGCHAFEECKSLQGIYIPASVTKIAEDAFYGSTPIIYTQKGSYAEQYAQKSDLQYVSSGEAE